MALGSPTRWGPFPKSGLQLLEVVERKVCQALCSLVLLGHCLVLGCFVGRQQFDLPGSVPYLAPNPRSQSGVVEQSRLHYLCILGLSYTR